MRAVVMSSYGDPSVLSWGQAPDPVLAPGEVLLQVAATAVNRADLMQRQGFYPPPPGASEVLGLECSGTVAAVGEDVEGWSVGDQACALLAGGGYAELVAVPAGQLLPVPDGVSLTDAAALPEVACTVWANVVDAGHLAAGETVLLHGGGSGIGTFAIQLCRELGARVAVTAGSAEKLDRCRELGAEILVSYKEQDFVAAVREATGGHGADVILDVVGAKYLSRNVDLLADDGRLMVIGLQGGTKGELDLGALLPKRAMVMAASLRARPPAEKARIVAGVRREVWPLVSAGAIRPVVDRRLWIEEVGVAHQLVADSGHVGKVVLTMADPAA